MAVVALPLLFFLLLRHMGRLSVGSLPQVLAAKAGGPGRKFAAQASLPALVASSIDLGALSALVTALAAVGDLGIWLWVLAAGTWEIAITAAVLLAVVLLVRTVFGFAVRILRRRGDTR